MKRSRITRAPKLTAEKTIEGFETARSLSRSHQGADFKGKGPLGSKYGKMGPSTRILANETLNFKHSTYNEGGVANVRE